MLSLETQKRLTEFLGEEPYRRYFVSTDVQGGSGDGYYVEEGERLDFDDWRVKGRLLKKFIGMGFEPKFTRYGVELCGEQYDDILTAIDSYLVAKEEGKCASE